jgi:hypothetical protein
MSDLRDRIRRTLEREDPPPGRLESTLARAHRRERTRRVTSAVVGLAMFGAVVVGVWIGTRPDRGIIGQDIPMPSGTTTVLPSSDTPSPHQSPEISPVARVACEEGRTIAVDDSVDALADGVHFAVENRTDAPIEFQDLGALAPGRIDEFVLSLEPREAEVFCSNEDGQFSHATIAIRDPHGYWISTDLQCREGDVSHTDVPFWNDGFVGNDVGYYHPVRQARRILPGVREDDVVERAAYPEARDSAVVRVVRGGVTVASAEFVRTGDLWRAVSFDLCGDESIGHRT